MENLTGKWGGIPLKDIKNQELNNFVHPDDINNLQFLKQPVNMINNIQNDYVNFTIDDTNFIRIKSTIVQEMKKPEYFINAKVRTLNSKGILEFALIKDFYWHVKDNKYIYLLEVNGKMKSRRYYAEDLENQE